jgi:hypothetical protein
VPEISRFLGIVVRMYYRDHAPPHFHASYGEFRVVVQIETGIVDGHFPPRAMRHLLEWMNLRQRELMEDWARAQAARPLEPIPPLE